MYCDFKEKAYPIYLLTETSQSILTLLFLRYCFRVSSLCVQFGSFLYFIACAQV